MAQAKDPWLMCVVYSACMTEITRVNSCSRSSSSSKNATDCLHRDFSIRTNDVSLPEALKLWVHLQVTCDV